MLELEVYRCWAPNMPSSGQSIVMQGEDDKKRGRRGQRVAANAWGDHDTRSKSQSGGNFGNGEKGKEWL